MPGTEQQSSPGRVNVHHAFNGDLNVQNSTFERRMKIKKLLVALQDDIKTLVGSDSRVDLAANIDIDVSGPNVTKQQYRVTIKDNTNAGLDPTATSSIGEQNSRPIPLVPSVPGTLSPSTSGTRSATLDGPSFGRTRPVDIDSLATAGWGQKYRSPSPPTSRIHEAFNNGEISLTKPERPRKRQRTNGNSGHLTAENSPPEARSRTPSLIQNEVQPPPRTPGLAPSEMQSGSVATSGDIMTFLHEWRNQWREQGGWMYDQFRTLSDQEQGKKAWTEHKLDTLQNNLGSSLSFQQTAATQELNNISKLLPWLETCRKAAADASQAREEKWRISSATFHDQARREREAAEKKILDEVKTQRRELEKQQRLIARLLDAHDLVNGGGTDDV